MSLFTLVHSREVEGLLYFVKSSIQIRHLQKLNLCWVQASRCQKCNYCTCKIRQAVTTGGKVWWKPFIFFHKHLSKGMRLHKFAAEASLCALKAKLQGFLCLFMCPCDRASRFLYDNEVPATLVKFRAEVWQDFGYMYLLEIQNRGCPTSVWKLCNRPDL